MSAKGCVNLAQVTLIITQKGQAVPFLTSHHKIVILIFVDTNSQTPHSMGELFGGDLPYNSRVVV